MCAVPPQEEAPEPAREPAPEPAGRVGVVLVSHSRDVARATAALARALTGTDDPAPVAPAGGLPDGAVGTSADLVRRAVAEADQGRGVVVLCDMGSAVLTVKALLADAAHGFGADADVRVADAPFVEGAVGALVTATAGGEVGAVLAAAEDARAYRKLP
ncbi:PTS-dependent dihydroxyacetone kinase phosphotransferase subunit DhaM [Streptomyces gamaensis]|uniref:PTS-dependent dihydroxyacetone kinase phosphotransferase subunit DhaM n=1 Tax=Streptomyces gamaensis TaxID=1763542 RepID=A0ABW0Z7E2_9ACTN